MSEEGERTDLQPNSQDYVASAAKAALGAVPFVGSLLSELAGTVIPNQRVDRVVKFAEQLERRLNDVQRDLIQASILDERFGELLEEALRQSSRSLSDQRREYLAALVQNSLEPEEIAHHESRHLLRLLGELNDLEIIWLRFYLNPVMAGDEAFREAHSEVLKPVAATIGGPARDVDQEALQRSYKQHLAQLGLLQPEFELDTRTKEPVFDQMTGAQKQRDYQITPLGRLLLRQIDLVDDERAA